jgi:hypothetical protein
MSDGTPTKIRIWHAARDAYHCAFRLLRLLVATPTVPVEFERLRILDLFLLAPSQLHRISMPMEMKSRFRELEIPSDEESFARLPSVAAMFQELRIYQGTAAGYLLAKDIFRGSFLRTGLVEFNSANIPDVLIREINLRNSTENALLQFLVRDLGSIPLSGGGDTIYRRAGLPGRHLLS